MNDPRKTRILILGFLTIAASIILFTIGNSTHNDAETTYRVCDTAAFTGVLEGIPDPHTCPNPNGAGQGFIVTGWAFLTLGVLTIIAAFLLPSRKACDLCRSWIDADATLCPHCRAPGLTSL